MRYTNGIIYGGDFRFHRGSFETEGGRFRRILLQGISERKSSVPAEDGKEEEPGAGRAGETDEVDLNGCYVIPGLIDVHFHGGAGVDFTEGDYEGLKAIASWLCQNGITSFSVASITQSEGVLTRAYESAARLAVEKPPGCARIAGVTMEGPFFSKAKKGAQPEPYLREPDYELMLRLARAAGGLLKIVCVAPELPGAMEFIARASTDYRVSLGHTAADYATARAAIAAGATQVTHLFNGMAAFHHREPGLIGAAAEDPRVLAELICDGVHVHESAVRAAFRLFGADRIVLISDCLSACGGREGGAYTSGGQRITLKHGAAVLPDGVTLAGSTTPLFQCMQKAMAFGIPPEDAVRAATANPAVSVGIWDEAGSIEAGKRADFLVCDKNFSLLQIYAEGRPILPQRC